MPSLFGGTADYGAGGNASVTEQEIGLPEGLIVRGVGGLYYVKGRDDVVHVLRAKGKFRRQRITPMVGDRVLYTPDNGDEHGWLEEILPRKNALVRPPVANVHRVMLVAAPEPAPDYFLIDTLLVMAHEQNIAPVLVANKCDISAALGEEMRRIYGGMGAPVLEVSAKTGQGLDALCELMKQGICCFAGQSGVGKSTLLSAATGLVLQTGEISRKTSRGKHTTRHAEILYCGEYCVLDTPGFSLLELWDKLEPIELKSFYPEFETYEGRCKFSPCYHWSEPGCAVLQAVSNGKIARERLERYHILLEKVQKAWRERY